MIFPSAPITAALLWYRPGARLSNRGTITVSFFSRAILPSASVECIAEGGFCIAEGGFCIAHILIVYEDRGASKEQRPEGPQSGADASDYCEFAKSAEKLHFLRICHYGHRPPGLPG